jgi:hypothetical protein
MNGGYGGIAEDSDTRKIRRERRSSETNIDANKYGSIGDEE